jgi:hypothetical protein
MKKKQSKVKRQGTLHTGRLIPITDPALQAALDYVFTTENPVIPQVLRDDAERLISEARVKQKAKRKSRKG